MDPNASILSAKKKFHFGKAWKLKGDTVAALASFREAIDLDPRLVCARLSLADLLLELGKINQALQQYDRALELEPEHPKLGFRSRHLRKMLAHQKSESANQGSDLELPDNPQGKIRIGRHFTHVRA